MPFDSEGARRKKLVHQQGAVAKVEFVPSDEPNSYTGVFKGAQHAIIRLSDADLFAHGVERPNGETFQQEKIQPSIAVKFLISGKPSANYLGMTGFED